VSASDEEPVLEVERPFEWGIVVLCDEQSTDVLPALERGDAFTASKAGLVIVVRHAQDSDVDLATVGRSDPISPFMVSIRCWVNTEPPPEATIHAVLDVPSGRVVIGDAEGWDAIDLTPGRWAVRAATTPVDYPEAVKVWFDKAND
jgi:hypothetical protein